MALFSPCYIDIQVATEEACPNELNALSTCINENCTECAGSVGNNVNLSGDPPYPCVFKDLYEDSVCKVTDCCPGCKDEIAAGMACVTDAFLAFANQNYMVCSLGDLTLDCSDSMPFGVLSSLTTLIVAAVAFGLLSETMM